MPACPRGRGQFSGCQQLRQADSNVVARHPGCRLRRRPSDLFIFYALVSWLSQCWKRRDTGPTSQKAPWNYAIGIIHWIWGWYLLKGQTRLCFPCRQTKGSIEEHQNTSEDTVSSDGARTETLRIGWGGLGLQASESGIFVVGWNEILFQTPSMALDEESELWLWHDGLKPLTCLKACVESV